MGESKGSEDLVEGPDTSSFTAFLYSLLSSSDSGDNNAYSDVQNDDASTAAAGGDGPSSDSAMKENLVVKRSLFSKSKQSLGRAVYQAAKMGGFSLQDRRDDFESDGHGVEMSHIQPVKEKPVVVPLVDHLPEISEPSMLISDGLRNAVYASLPALIHGRKWIMLYR